ncbi:hypothetical protein L1276_001880 [Flavobacterium sp. HSC-32F16]|uniref:hypothetical protein n=1 Tax=Flavobacterium sp. HSC-32F16 TaxID=2910964 RepID=UPI0020A39623|nr:hypothetical protein [Flavobacterium sp. HSC-32F16]MCP2026736.1 hypothetical protein [Flavobacterium sp. HSC-32F16]
MKKFKNLHETQKFAIAIPILFVISGATRHYLENFRGTLTYAYGATFTLFLSLFLVVFSFVNSILIVKDLRLKFVPKSLWLLLNASIFLYMFIAMTIAMFT